MLSSVLRSERAVEVNIAIMRTFVQLRCLMDSNALLAEKIEDLEEKYGDHDQQFQLVFGAIKQLIASPIPSAKELGFHTIPIHTFHQEKENLISPRLHPKILFLSVTLAAFAPWRSIPLLYLAFAGSWMRDRGSRMSGSHIHPLPIQNVNRSNLTPLIGQN